jgi:chromosome segregation ATPase
MSPHETGGSSPEEMGAEKTAERKEMERKKHLLERGIPIAENFLSRLTEYVKEQESLVAESGDTIPGTKKVLEDFKERLQGQERYVEQLQEGLKEIEDQLAQLDEE